MYLVTGSAGFIGFHLCLKLLEQNAPVIGIDNLNDYYDVSLKHARLQLLKQYPNFIFEQLDITDKDQILKLDEKYNFSYIVNLAAQPGVRYSTINPYSYTKNNVEGQLVMLELARKMGTKLKHFVFASSSSVYGANTKVPFAESDEVMSPVSMYAATKLAQEHLGFSYNQMYKIPITGLRFFTVYGPFGRPDMAIFDFTNKIYNQLPITVYGQGRLKRDFTYIDDIVSGIISALNLNNKSGYHIYNLGNNKPVEVNQVIAEIESRLNRKAIIEYQPKPIGDVDLTYADITKAEQNLGFIPVTSITDGIKNFVDWYLHYMHNNSVI